jgi:hypothetical protein
MKKYTPERKAVLKCAAISDTVYSGRLYCYLNEGSNLITCGLLHNLYSLPSIIRIIKSRRMRWAGHVARMGEKRNMYRLLVGKSEGKRPLGRPRRRWIDNIKMKPLEIGLGGVDWIGLAQDRYRWRALVNSVMNLRVP